jgi:hypothetical protein
MDSIYLRLFRLVIIPILTLVIAYLINENFKEKKRKQHNKRVNFNSDIRPIILYLRAFSKDGLKTMNIPLPFGYSSQQFPIKSFEMKLDKQIQKIGKFYAIGHPLKNDTDIGAVRESFTNEEWKNAVLQKMKEAIIIIFRPSISEGTIWEFEQIIKYDYLKKTIIAISEDNIEYDHFKEFIKDWGPNLPLISSKEAYLCFDTESKVSTFFQLNSTPLFLKHNLT